MVKKKIGITMGDPAGIGPEILLKTLQKREIRETCTPIVIGDLTLLQYTANKMRLELQFESLCNQENFQQLHESIGIVDLQNVDLDALQIGEISKEAGRASIEYLKRGVQYAMDGNVDALVTAPINKEAIHLAGSTAIGHTELLGALTDTDTPITMF